MCKKAGAIWIGAMPRELVHPFASREACQPWPCLWPSLIDFGIRNCAIAVPTRQPDSPNRSPRLDKMLSAFGHEPLPCPCKTLPWRQKQASPILGSDPYALDV